MQLYIPRVVLAGRAEEVTHGVLPSDETETGKIGIFLFSKSLCVGNASRLRDHRVDPWACVVRRNFAGSDNGMCARRTRMILDDAIGYEATTNLSLFSAVV